MMKILNKPLLAAVCMAIALPRIALADEPPAVDGAAAATEVVPQNPLPAETAPEQEATSQPAASQPIPIPVAPDTPRANSRSSAAVSTKLDEVIVTATKRAQSARDIPSTVDVIKGAKLESIGARDLKDFVALVPGINTQDEIVGEQRHLSVRGVGPSDTTNQTVGVVLGDIALSDPYGALTIVDPNPWDMASVEVLKGPQGSLFGATSLAGLLRYVPNEPLLNTWEAKGFTEYVHIHEGGSDPTFGAALNVPVGSTLAFRASGIWQHAPGVIDENNPSLQQKNSDRSINDAGRIMGLWQPLERLTVNALYMQELRRANDTNFVTNQSGNLERDDAPSLSPARNGYHLATLDTRYRFDWATLASITGYTTKTSFNNVDTSFLVDPVAVAGISYLHAERMVATRGLQQELRLTSPDGGRWNWLVGAYYSIYRANTETYLYVPTGTVVPSSLLADIPLSLQSLDGTGNGADAEAAGIHPLIAGEQSLFGETNFDLFSNLRLTGGGRFYRADVKGTVQSSGAGSAENGASANQQSLGFSPKAAITYRPWTDVMLYGNVTRGFQFGGFNLATVDLPTDSIPPTYKSSSLWNYEVGTRTDWLHKTLRFDFTLFYVDWKDAQVSQVTSDGLTGYVDNVGAVHSEGAEATLRYLTPIRGLSIEEAASYIVARTAVPFSDSAGNEVSAGSIFPSSPKIQTTTNLSYKLVLDNWTTVSTIMDSFQGKAYVDIAHDHIVGNYNDLDLFLNVGRNDMAAQPTLTFSITNLLDRRAIVSELGQPPMFPTQPALSNFVGPLPTVYNRPRTFSIRLSMQF
jgi:outer membrane receptor protein involved in Fe transport